MRSGILKSFGRVLAVASAALLVTSCFKDVEPRPNDNGGTTGKNGETTFIIDVPGAAVPITRGIDEGSDKDNAIHDLVFLLFDPETHEYIDMVAATDITTVPDQINRKKATVPDMPEGEYLAFVVANYLKSMVVSENLPDITNEDEAFDHFSQSMDSAFSYGGLDSRIDANEFSGPTMFDQIDNGFFVMGGYYDIPEYRKTMESVYLQRSLAKINVVGTAVKDDFKISEIRVVNGNRVDGPYVCDILPAMLEDGETVSMFDPDHLNPVIRSRTADCFGSALVYSSDDDQIDADNSCIDEIFLPEVAVPDGIDEDDLRNSTNDAWKDAVAVLIKADLPEHGERWFRVNLRMPDADNGDKLRHVNIVRNYSYTINITKAEGRGYATAKEAYDALPGDLIVDLVAIDDTDMNNIVYNGQYYLAVNGDFTYDGFAYDGSLSSYDGVFTWPGDKLKIYTDYPGGWKVESITGNDDNWLTGIDELAGNGLAEMPLTVPMYPGVFDVRPTPRTATVTISAGPLTTTVEITQSALDKVLAAPGMIGIKKSDYDRLVAERARRVAVGDPQGNSYLDPGIQLTIKGSSTYTGTWVEEEIAGKGEFSEIGGLEDEPVYTVYFKWGSMVAMIGGTGDTWSVNDVVWVNPGFTRTIGVYASFTPASFTTYGVGGGRIDVIESIPDGHGDPCKWVNGANGDGDWRTPTGVPYTMTKTYNKFDGTGGTNTPFGTSTAGSPRIGWGTSRNTTNKAVTYWNSSSGSVPSQATLGFTRASVVTTGVYPNGAALSDNRDLFLPATGYRGNASGTVSQQGSNGFYWTSTSYGYNNDSGATLGGGLFFDNVGVYSSNNGINSNGAAVRCVNTSPTTP